MITSYIFVYVFWFGQQVSPILCPPPSSKPVAEAESPLGEAVEQPLSAIPLTVWNPPSDNAKLPPREVAEPKRKKLKTKVDEVKASLLSNTELAAGAVSSILKDSILESRKGYPLMRLWLYPIRGLPR